ncbi:MAG TPA: hypothetical protein VEQ58_22945 [Polyangiaceae bacterium]|nr:hypothetical protein [Polyangiaceae bacterium]
MPLVSSAEFPSLFSHTKRTNWGVGVVAEERDGKRTYLFEDGEERTLGVEGIGLMRKIEQPDRDQQATCTHLLSLLAKREGRREPTKAAGTSAMERQIDRFRKKFRGGFSGGDWKGDKSAAFARHARGAISQRVQERLSAESMQQRLADKDYAGLCKEAATLLAESGLATKEKELSLPEAPAEQQRLAEALYGLLHGQESYEHRFDQWIAAYISAFKDAPSWQIATALPALFSPVDHIYVEVTSFRKQLKALAREGTIGARPNGAAYVRCLTGARALAHLLATRGEVPLDLLDVHDFIRT